ncbi:glycosyltransferase family 4 protein [Arthrobacter sedimenti]|uniref:glycosyltransferase family 4 protein n=1 Tax=Arthrobacter sedimenti TaxID=2694931 RepID=UPI001423B19D|nr:glycosyltransferase family 4 protein [Arthrobacter sedimenti]
MQLVNKRFSRSIDEVGRFTGRKLVLILALAREVWTASSKKPKVAILFATTRKGSFIVDLLINEILRMHRTPRILYIHTVGFTALANSSKIWHILVRRMFRGAQKVVVLSERLTKDLEPFVSEHTFETISNCAPDESFALLRETAPERSSITFISNLIPSKGAHDFVHIAERLTSDHKHSFELVGADADEDYTQMLRSEIARIKNKSIILHGPLFGDDKKDILRRSKVLVFPSTYKYEAQPLTLIEALQHGVPVVAYDVGGIGDIVQDGVEGFVVPVGDKVALEHAVEKIVNDEHRCAMMADACRQKFRSTFSRPSFDESWKELLHDFL